MMKKELYLLRHAKSDWSAHVDDHERPLNPRGRQACKQIADYLVAQSIVPDHIACSSAVRVAETWDRIHAATGYTVAPVVVKKLYLASAGELFSYLQALPLSCEKVLLIAHHPGIAQLVELLSRGQGNAEAWAQVSYKYVTAGLACLHGDVSWNMLQPGSMQLADFVTPRMLAS